MIESTATDVSSIVSAGAAIIGNLIISGIKDIYRDKKINLAANSVPKEIIEDIDNLKLEIVSLKERYHNNNTDLRKEIYSISQKTEVTSALVFRVEKGLELIHKDINDLKELLLNRMSEKRN